MRRFAPALRRISSELPEPIRSRIVLELVADLESLVAHYRAQGLTESEAMRRAEEKLLVSSEALRHLIAVHTTPYQRFVSAAVGRLRWGFDLVLFFAGVLPVLLIGVYVIGTQSPQMLTAPLLWPIVIAACGVVITAGVKVYQLFMARERNTAVLHRWMDFLVFFGAAGPVIGTVAAVIGLDRLMAALSGGPIQERYRAVVEQAGRDATLLALGLLLGFGAGLVWFVLVNRIAAIERTESAAFLALDQEP